MGITFKENCPYIRNSKVIDIYKELLQFGFDVDVYDLHANKEEVLKEYGIVLCDSLGKYHAIILAVSHNEFLSLDLANLKQEEKSVIFDSKSFLNRELVDGRL